MTERIVILTPEDEKREKRVSVIFTLIIMGIISLFFIYMFLNFVMGISANALITWTILIIILILLFIFRKRIFNKKTLNRNVHPKESYKSSFHPHNSRLNHRFKSRFRPKRNKNFRRKKFRR